MNCYLDRVEDMRRFFRARLGGTADVDDLVQELFLKVRGLPHQEIENPAAYLYRLASNLMIDRLRSAKLASARDGAWRSLHHQAVNNDDVADEPTAEASVIARQRMAMINKALETLAPRTREIFRLHKVEGLSHVETAARLGISRSAVEKHVSLALQHLLTRIGR